MKENTLDTPLLLFNLHEILVRDDEVVLSVESFLFLGIKIVFLTIVQPFSEREDISIPGENSDFGMQQDYSATRDS